MRVFVSGASGFIGSVLVRELRARAFEVCASVDGAEVVVHLANIAHARVSSSDLRRVNVEGTMRAALDAARAGVRRFVYLSSAKAIAPDDDYGRTKLEAERALSRIEDIEVVVLRPPLVYGPGVKANFLALLGAVDRGWPFPFASVANRRSLVYVANLVDAIVACLHAPLAPDRVYAVSDGAAVSTPALIRALARAMGRPARLFPFPPALLDWVPPLRSLVRSLEVDDSAIRRELGWHPPYTFEEGLRATAEWYLAQRR